MIWLDWNWKSWGIGGYVEHAPAWQAFPALTKLELWIGPLTISGRWEGKEKHGCRENVRRR